VEQVSVIKELLGQRHTGQKRCGRKRKREVGGGLRVQTLNEPRCSGRGEEGEVEERPDPD